MKKGYLTVSGGKCGKSDIMFQERYIKKKGKSEPTKNAKQNLAKVRPGMPYVAWAEPDTYGMHV